MEQIEEATEAQTPLVVTNKNTYQPNIKDPRVAKRCKEVIGGIKGLFREDESKHSARVIDTLLGHHSNPLSRWLREVLLITTNEFYSKDAKTPKGRKLNADGFSYLVKFTNGKTESSWDTYNKNLQLTKLQETAVKLSDINTSNELEEIKNLTHELALNYCEIQFGELFRRGEIFYTEKSNRYWHRLQNFPSQIRDAFLARHGFKYDYDIECCNITLIMQYAEQCAHSYRKQNPNKKGPVLRNSAILQYMHDKINIRQEIADELRVPIETVKMVLTALVNGASLRCRWGYLYNELGMHLSLRFYRIAFIKKFIDNIKSCWECINSYDDRRKLKLRSINNQQKHVKSKLSSKQKSEMYLELEKKVTDVIRNWLSATKQEVFFIHDGWVTKNIIDTYELANFIKEKTNYSIKIDLKHINTEQA